MNLVGAIRGATIKDKMPSSAIQYPVEVVSPVNVDISGDHLKENPVLNRKPTAQVHGSAIHDYFGTDIKQLIRAI